MDEELIEALARAAGLDKALAQFHADVVAAARQAEDLRATLKRSAMAPLTPRDEPSPSMRVEGER